MIKTCVSLLDEEGAVVRKEEHADERFTWMLVAEPLPGTASLFSIHLCSGAGLLLNWKGW